MTSKRTETPSELPPSSKGMRDSLKARQARKQRVMVVDDSEICLDIVSMQLEEAGFEVVTVDSPFGLSSALAATPPDMVLVDVNMPGLSGDKLVEITLRGVPVARRVTIVLHSDRPPEELRRRALECGAAGYIAKGTDAEALVREVKRFIGP